MHKYIAYLVYPHHVLSRCIIEVEVCATVTFNCPHSGMTRLRQRTLPEYCIYLVFVISECLTYNLWYLLCK